MKTIAIIGGGAAGLMAAYAASRTVENSVILYERQARVGRKLLATGNGRCNLTNLNAGVSHYHGADPAFVRPALEALSVADTLALFHDLGLLTVEGEGTVEVLLPVFAFDGEIMTEIRTEETTVEVRYKGHGCRYTAENPIVWSENEYANRNGHYRMAKIRGKNRVSVKISLE